MKNLIFAFIISVFVLPQTVFSCTLGLTALSKFDTKEYIFIGEVVGYTKVIESKKLNSSTYGLIIKNKESVYLPKTSKGSFEVFPFGLGADCSLFGTDIEELKKDFPLNSEVRVIAKEAKVIPKTKTNTIRLEKRPDELSSIALNSDEQGNRMTSSKSVFDYKTFEYQEDDSFSKYLLPEFEIRKDLLRLKMTKNQIERNKILDRLFYAPVYTDLNFGGLFQEHTSSISEYERYYESHLKMTDPEFYEKQYLVYKETLAELLKLGYKKKVAENALGKAIEKSDDFSKESWLKMSLQILKNK
jgi:hypothetical protein